MTAVYNPKTLAKTISYIGYHSPAEFGLFWDLDGSMPWKEFYWALQEDSSLRFVRESHLKELAYLGMELPFTLESGLLRLRDAIPRPEYATVPIPPERLFFPFRVNQVYFLKKNGIKAAGRSFVPLFADRDFALRMGKRRDPSPLVLEILWGRAAPHGFTVLKAGDALYLVSCVPPDCLLFPHIREDALPQSSMKKARGQKALAGKQSETPGSFIMETKHLEEARQGQAKPAGKKHSREPGWKRNAKKERFKRTL